MTDAEVAEFGCVVCRFYHQVYSPAEVHHLREDTGLALKSDIRIGLCPLHHRLGGVGVALHAGVKSFVKNYGTQTSLYERMLMARKLPK